MYGFIITRIAPYPDSDRAIFEARTIGRWVRSGRQRRKVFSEEACFKIGDNLDQLAELCREPEAIAKACGFTSSLGEEGEKNRLGLYVISADAHKVCKIGVSHCPTSRLASLQENHWAELRLHAVLWCCLNRAETVEQVALRHAAELGLGLRGEWVDTRPEEAFEIVLKAAGSTDVPVCDSATWIKNWNVRTRAMAEALYFRKAA